MDLPTPDEPSNATVCPGPHHGLSLSTSSGSRASIASTGKLLPSTLAWLYTHKAVSLAFSILVWMVATTIAALNLFGRLRK